MYQAIIFAELNSDTTIHAVMTKSYSPLTAFEDMIEMKKKIKFGIYVAINYFLNQS